MPIRLYRITHLDNLPHILAQGGIWCGNEMARQDLSFVSIGDKDLTHKRSVKPVSIAAGGTLNDYVPFYFCPRSVMLYLIERRHPSTYGGGQEPILHLVTDVDRVRATDTPCFFTNRQAYIYYAQQIDDFSRLEELDWETLQSRDWQSTPEDPERQERKMAEFLAHRFVPWSCIVGIGVYSERYREDAVRLLAGADHLPKVQVVPKWYY